jgi:hypothetical protein
MKTMRRYLTTAVMVITCLSYASGQPADVLKELLEPPPIEVATNLPPLSPIAPKPTPQPLPELPPSVNLRSPLIITSSNRGQFPIAFEIEVVNGGSRFSNVVFDLKIFRKYDLENLQTVQLFVGEPSDKMEMIAMISAKVFSTLWRKNEQERTSSPEAVVRTRFALSRELSKEAYIRMETFLEDTKEKQSFFYTGPQTVYLIDLNSFVPPPPAEKTPPNPSSIQTNVEDTLTIEIL